MRLVKQYYVLQENGVYRQLRPEEVANAKDVFVSITVGR